MTDLWEPTAAGVLRLPSGRLVRGRGLRRPLPPGPRPAFALYLLGHRPPDVAWESRWLRWPDFRLPSDRAATVEALREAWERAEGERVEIACAGGRGRTGTALAHRDHRRTGGERPVVHAQELDRVREQDGQPVAR
ncbi:hypothetical protein, partial [Streptomyces sp. NPDC001919]